MKIEIYRRCEEMPQCSYMVDYTPIFAHQIWADWLKKAEGREVCWLVAEDVLGSLILPLAVQKKAVFKIGQFQTGVLAAPPNLMAPPNLPKGEELTSPSLSKGEELGYLGGAGTGKVNLVLSNDVRLAREKDFLASVVAFIQKEKLCDWISSPPNWGLFDVVPEGSLSAPFGTYLIDLQAKSLDGLFSDFRKDCRNNIRRAEKDGVEIVSGPDQLNVVYEMMLNVAKKNRQFMFSYAHYKSMLNHFKDHMLLYAAYYNDEPQIGKFRLYSQYSSYGLGAGRIDYTTKGAGNLTTWVEIQDLKALGVKYYDFVGARINPSKNSKQYHIQSFKEGFGAELKTGYLWKQSFNPLKSFAYDSLLRVKLSFSGSSYKGDVIDQEGSSP